MSRFWEAYMQRLKEEGKDLGLTLELMIFGWLYYTLIDREKRGGLKRFGEWDLDFFYLI